MHPPICQLFAITILAGRLTANAADLVIDPSTVTATFDPRSAFGATIDAHEQGENAQIFTPPNVAAMLSAGFQPLSYRLATELGAEAWHWNPKGTWSETTQQQGYWTSSATPAEPIDLSYGYRLPRRGNTIDQAANDSYSRVDDGDSSTFWKSNPYLGDNPQWLLADLGSIRNVMSIRIRWAAPFALDYEIQRWTGSDPINSPADGRWLPFPRGTVRDGKGGESRLRLAETPVAVRYVRLLMTRSSHTSVKTFASERAGAADIQADSDQAIDPRDSTGYAVAEVSILDRRGHDLVKHGHTRGTQSVMWTSSTDPWHRAVDRDLSVEQLGLDRLYSLGLTRGLPTLIPVALLYGTPEDAAAEVKYLRARGYPFARVEMGEEPDGQFMTPEDYAALYLRWADALHDADHALQLGGPAFQSTNNVIAHWPDEQGRTSWIGRFIDVLRQRGRLADFNFFSFEWYPFDNLCLPSHPQLINGPAIVDRVLKNWHDEGVPSTIPWLATEYGYSSYAGEPEVSIGAALFNAEFVAQFLSRGGTAAYFYGLEPDVLLRELACPTYGNLILFQSDDRHHILHATAAYHGARMLTQHWTMPTGPHEIHPVSGTSELLTAYALHRPDDRWSILVINKNATTPLQLRLHLGKAEVPSMQVEQFSPAEYVWHPRGEDGYPSPDSPPRSFRAEDSITLPAMSMSVITF